MTTEVYKSKRAFIEGLQAKVGEDKLSMNKSIRLPVFGFATEDKVYQANNAVCFVKTFNELFGEVAPVDLKFTRTAGKNTFLINFIAVEDKEVVVIETPIKEVEAPIEDLKESLDEAGEELVKELVKEVEVEVAPVEVEETKKPAKTTKPKKAKKTKTK